MAEARSANDVCIGIRTDNGSLNSAGRAVLGILGTVGSGDAFWFEQGGSRFADQWRTLDRQRRAQVASVSDWGQQVPPETK